MAPDPLHLLSSGVILGVKHRSTDTPLASVWPSQGSLEVSGFSLVNFTFMMALEGLRGLGAFSEVKEKKHIALQGESWVRVPQAHSPRESPTGRLPHLLTLTRALEGS